MPVWHDTASARALVAATIASGASLSAQIDIGGYGIGGIMMPAGWDAASLTFQVASAGGGTFNNLYNRDGTEYSVTVGAGRCVMLPLADFAPFQFIKIRSGTSAAAVNQTAERSFTLMLYPV